MIGDPPVSGLLTDLYELTMAQGYYHLFPEREAVCDLFFRDCPFGGGYAVFAGLGPLLKSLSELSFSSNEIDYLGSLGTFEPDFLEFLAEFRFHGHVFSIDEGRMVFPNEPLIRIHGSIIEAQLVESLVLNTINFQTLIATKAARIVDSAGGSGVLEFGLRRAQGPDGSMAAVRAARIGGVDGTSNVLAGMRYKMPVVGTMAHSWVMCFHSELEAFRAYAREYPDNCILLVDTYDTLESGIPNAIIVLGELQAGHPDGKMGIRLDSGDLDYLGREARRMLDDAGLEDAVIVASNELDEKVIAQIRSSGGRVDAWGVGTRLVTGWESPALNGVYKLCAVDGDRGLEPRLKVSDHPEKTTNPGMKNVIRLSDEEGSPLADLVCLDDETDSILCGIGKGSSIRLNHPVVDYEGITLEGPLRAEPLLKRSMADGRMLGEPPSLEDVSRRRESDLAALHESYRRLLNPYLYKVSLSDELAKLKLEMIRSHRGDSSRS